MQVEIYRAANPQQAQILVNLLESEGIWAMVSGGSLANASDAMGWAVDPAVVVHQADYAAAREIAEQFDQQLQRKRMQPAADDAPQLEADVLEAIHARERWPDCPACGRRRETRCPNCHRSGTDFVAAEFISADGTGGIEAEGADDYEIVPDDLRLMCTLCDRAFSPDYAAECSCGYHFPDGWPVHWAAATESETTRTWWFAGAVLIGIMLWLAVWQSITM